MGKAVKLLPATAKRAKALKINVATEKELRERLLEILEKEGVEGMDEEDTDTLLDIAESFVDEDQNPSEEEENDELAKEVEEEESEEEETEEEGDDEEPEEEESDEEEEEEEEEKPSKKLKPAPKKEKKASSRGVKLDPRNNAKDQKEFDSLKEIFPEKDYTYAWIATAGVTIKFKGKNSSRAFVTIENCSKKEDGSIKCNLYLLTFVKKCDILDEKGIEYEKCWSGAPFMKGITLDEAIEIIKELIDEMKSSVEKIDKKLGENRKKMEENLKKNSKPASKKVEEPEDEEEEEEEEEKPAPKKAAKKVAEKPSKKAKK